MAIVKIYKSLKNHGRSSFFRMGPKENPDKVEQDFLRGRGEFSVMSAMAFDRHLQKIREYGEVEGLWFEKGGIA